MKRPLLVVFLAGATLFGGCLGRSAPPRGEGSALWMANESGELTGADQARLAALGVREMFLDAGDLTWGGPEIRRRTLPRVPRRTPSTLVVYGAWQPGNRDPDEAADRLLTELQALRIEAEQTGVLVAGFHFEVDPGERGEHYAKTLKKLRSSLGGTAYLSCGIDRHRLDHPQSAAIAAASDFVTSFLYGQRPGESEDPTAWDLEEVERNFRRLESLRRPYLVGAITLGTATLRNRSGGTRAQTTALALGDLIRSSAFTLKPGFSLQGVDRQIWEFVAEGPAKVGDWSVERGESIRIVRTATPLVEEFRRRVGAWDSALRLGEVYFRLPKPAERLSLSAANLETVIGPESASFDLALSLTRTVTSRDLWVVTARLENLTAENSDLAFFDSNYVQIDVEGAVPTDAERGQFRRSELLHDGDRSSMQALRSANQVRLYLPYVDGHQVAESGPVTLRLRGENPQLRISASFLLPEGRVFATDPIDWSFEAP